ncbi:hypothetical protein OG738_22795 [Amycolatopsis sp. NBC_01488]|uniref:hypothetical protein n=1 Tax=Amycolatopsis sp. NBC_01488 TaxID=2903563 RepID=UPI002E2B7A1A|nr:hypothetical protein [Amycolatopsis sp. NBC_01488]
MLAGGPGALLDGMSGGFGFPFGCVAAVVAALVAEVCGATGHPWYALVTLGVVVLLTAFWSPLAAGFGVAVVAWALDSGFVLGRAGELTFSPASAFAALTLFALLALGLLARLAARPPVRIPAPRRPVSTPRSREIALQSREFRLQSRESRT